MHSDALGKPIARSAFRQDFNSPWRLYLDFTSVTVHTNHFTSVLFQYAQLATGSHLRNIARLHSRMCSGFPLDWSLCFVLPLPILPASLTAFLVHLLAILPVSLLAFSLEPHRPPEIRT